jgi:hypothetical protein
MSNKACSKCRGTVLRTRATPLIRNAALQRAVAKKELFHLAVRGPCHWDYLCDRCGWVHCDNPNEHAFLGLKKGE